MITVTKQYRAEIAHRLMEYEGKCAHLHGHSYLFEVTVHGEVDDRGILIDFKDLKKVMEDVLGPYDHSLVLREDDPLATAAGPEIYRATNGDSGRVHLWSRNPTAEEMAHVFGHEIRDRLPTGCHITHVRVWETPNSHADIRWPVVEEMQ